MKTQPILCFDCDEPLTAEALEFHPARCPACFWSDYERELEDAAEQRELEPA
jgi:hypothetical protein